MTLRATFAGLNVEIIRYDTSGPFPRAQIRYLASPDTPAEWVAADAVCLTPVIVTENGITTDTETGEVLDRYTEYCRWAIGPLYSREQWEADQRLDWPAWRKKHGV